MARIEITIPGERIVEEFTALVARPTAPSSAPPPPIGLVEISHSQPTELIPGPVGPQGPRGSRWTTGAGDPTVPGGVIGDMYLDDVSGAVWAWDGTAWVNTGTNIQGSPDTGPDILAKLAPVDGAGSGLDADTVDGMHAAEFATDAELAALSASMAAADNLRVLKTGDTMTGKLLLTSTATTAGINLIPNAASPSAPVDGDMWITAANFVWRVNGVTHIGINSAGNQSMTGIKTFTQSPILPTPTAGDNSTKGATTAFVKAAVDVGVASGLQDAPSDGLTYGRKNATWATIVGGAVISDTPPPGPLTPGQLWWESDTGNTFLWFDDGDTQQWVQQNIQPAPSSVPGHTHVIADVTGLQPALDAKFDKTGGTVSGGITVNGRVTANTYFQTSDHIVVVGTTVANSSGYVSLRPVANASTNAFTVNYNGTVDCGGTITLSSGSFVGASIQANSSTSNFLGGYSSTGANLGLSINSWLRISASSSSSTTLQTFYNTNGAVGTIVVNGTATGFNTSSDANLKNVGGEYDPQEAIAIIRADPVMTWAWKSDGETAVGWVAQKSYAVNPDLAAPPSEPNEEDLSLRTDRDVEPKPGEPGYIPWGIDYGKRTPYLWAALSAALDKIDQLEARLAALETA